MQATYLYSHYKYKKDGTKSQALHLQNRGEDFMRKRNIKINIFLSEEEKEIFDKKVNKSGLKNKSEFFRKIILDYQLKEQPDERFYEILYLLRNMANNLNQMARTYNRYQGYIREDSFTPLVNQIQDFILSMEEIYLIPQKKGVQNGDNKDMEI